MSNKSSSQDDVVPASEGAVLSRDEAQRIAEQVDGPGRVANALASDLLYAVRRYTAQASCAQPRLADDRRELEEFLDVVRRASRSRWGRKQMQRRARRLPESAWRRLGGLPDEDWVLTQALGITRIRQKRGKAERADYKKLKQDVLQLITNALEIMPPDKGGRQRNEAARRFLTWCALAFLQHTGTVPSVKFYYYHPDIVSRNEFTTFILETVKLLIPPINERFAIGFFSDSDSDSIYTLDFYRVSPFRMTSSPYLADLWVPGTYASSG